MIEFDIDTDIRKTNEISKVYHVYPSVSHQDIGFTWPPKDIINENYKFKAIDPKYFRNFMCGNGDGLQNVISSSFLTIAINEDLSNYYKSISGIVEFTYLPEDGIDAWDENILDETPQLKTVESQKVLVTSYSLIKNLLSKGEKDFRRFSIFILPNLFNEKICSLIQKLDYITKLKQDTETKKIFLSEIIKCYSLIEANANKSFLNIRKDFLKSVSKDHFKYIFKEPITDKMTLPIMDMMILDLPFILQEHPYYTTIDIPDLSNKNCILDGELILSMQYLDKEEIISKNKFCEDEFSKEVSDLYLHENFFPNKEMSLNFGKIEKSGELGSAKFNFDKHYPGSIIYSKKFKPLGISTTTIHNHNLCNFITADPSNYNVILPFTNLGVRFIVKKFLGSSVDEELAVINRKNFFNVNKSKKDKIAFFISEETDDDSNENTKEDSFKYERRIPMKKMQRKTGSAYDAEFFQKLKSKSFIYPQLNIFAQNIINQTMSLADEIEDTVQNLFSKGKQK